MLSCEYECVYVCVSVCVFGAREREGGSVRGGGRKINYKNIQIVTEQDVEDERELNKKTNQGGDTTEVEKERMRNRK